MPCKPRARPPRLNTLKAEEAAELIKLLEQHGLDVHELGLPETVCSYGLCSSDALVRRVIDQLRVEPIQEEYPKGVFHHAP